MSPSIVPFQQAQSGFQNQLDQFNQFAQQGFPLSNFLTTSAPQQTSGGAAPQAAPGSNCAWWDLTCHIASRVAGVPGTSITWTRIAAFLLGLIAIAGAIYLFKPTQEIVKSAVKGAAIA